MDIEAYISSGILEAHALGATSVEEAAILSCVAKNNPRVQEALTEAMKTLEGFSSLHTAPAPDLKSVIWNRIQAEQKNKPAATKTPISIPLPLSPNTVSAPRIFVWKALAAAAVLLLCVSTLGYFKSRKEAQQANTLLAQAGSTLSAQEKELAEFHAKTAVLMQQGIDVIVLNGVESHPDNKAMVFWNKKDRKVYLDALHLPQAPAGKQYQLWAMVGGKPVNAGMYEGDVRQPLSTVGVAQAFAITLEKTGGVPSPTMTNLMVMGTVVKG